VTERERNWAGNHVFTARSIVHPESLDEVRRLVRSCARVRALGSRHSFTDVADTTGTLVSLDRLPADTRIDPQSRTVEVGAAVRYGALASELHDQGWALANLASLPHISVAGAVATGTHGSGAGNQSLSAAVQAVELVGAAGDVRVIRGGEADFDGAVVSLGALGVVTRVTLAVEPTFDVWQRVFTGLPWSAVDSDLEAVMGAAYSVSLFTRWGGDDVDQVWVKSREPLPGVLFGAVASDVPLHMLAGADVAAVTEQSGEPGPWFERLPHFRMAFTPSRGEELQSEYLLPRSHGAEAIRRLRGLADVLAPVLQVSEIRTVAADDLWLSGAYGRDSIAVHFTWQRDVPAVYDLLPRIEDVLRDLSPRPHWGKCFTTSADDLRTLYPRFADFVALRDRLDPDRRFGNAFLDRVLAV
jgi:xylitol oxidase